MTMTHSYKVTLKVTNEVGVLARISTLLRKFRVNISSLDSAPLPGKSRFSEIRMILDAKQNKEEFAIIMRKTHKLVPVLECSFSEI